MESAAEFPLSPEFRSLGRGIGLTRKPRPVSFTRLPITYTSHHLPIKLEPCPELQTTLRLTRSPDRLTAVRLKNLVISGRAEDWRQEVWSARRRLVEL